MGLADRRGTGRVSPVPWRRGRRGILPSLLEGSLEAVAYAVAGVGVEAAHTGDFVAQALFGQDLGDAVFGHPCLVALAEAVRGEAGLEREPAGQQVTSEICVTPGRVAA
jgi:hypothetical protein